MTDKAIGKVFANLDALLEEERAALLRGDLDELEDMHARKSALLDQLHALDAARDADALHDLQAKLTRNHALLDSAMLGIRAVARRLAAVRRVRETLDTYDEDGNKSSVDISIARAVEKRA